MFARSKIGAFRAIVLAALHVAMIAFPLAAGTGSSLLGDVDRSLACLQNIDAAHGHSHDWDDQDDYGPADVHQPPSSDHSHETANAVAMSGAPAPCARQEWWPANPQSIDQKPCLKIKRPPRLPASV